MKEMKKPIFLFFTFLLLSLGAVLSSDAETRESPLVVAEGKGVGPERDEALRLAWQDAVRKATGLVMDSTTVRRGENIVDSITLLSRGYIEKYELLEEKELDGVFHTSVKAWIRRDVILQGLLAERPSEYAVEGRSLYAQALTKEQQIREAVEILDEWLSAFKYENYLIASVSDPVFRHGAGEVVFKVALTFDTKRFYNEFSRELARLLDYVALARERSLPMHLPVDTRSGKVSLPFTRQSVGEYVGLLGLDSAKARKPHVRMTALEGMEHANVYLATSTFYFSAYRLPEEVFDALWSRVWKGTSSRIGGAFFRGGNLRIAMKSEGGTDLLTHDKPLNINNVILFPDPRAPLMARNGPGKEQALFLIPAFGNKQSTGKNDYDLFPRAETEIVIKVAPDIMRSVAKASCFVTLKR